MTKVLYKKGYLIRVTSWENDADNYNTKEVQAETEQEAKDIVDFCWLFKSRSRDKSSIGNIYEMRGDDEDRVKTVLNDFYEGHRGMFPEDCEDAEEAMEYLHDYTWNLGLCGEEFYTRVCDSVEILLFAEDVICEEVKF